MSQVVELGRAVRIELTDRQGMTARWFCIHEFGFSLPTITHLIRRIEEDIIITKSGMSKNASGLIADMHQENDKD